MVFVTAAVERNFDHRHDRPVAVVDFLPGQNTAMIPRTATAPSIISP